MSSDVIVHIDSEFGRYEVTDTIYSGRRARVLYSGAHQAAQSGLALDDRPELLFDYNERFMELCRGILPHKVLVLGGGACTLPKALLEEFPDIVIDIVEIDEQLIAAARNHFGFKPSGTTRIFTEDARKFLARSTDEYDLIIIDIFNHAAIPLPIQTVEMARQLASHLTKQGVVAMNIIATFIGEPALPLKRQTAALREVFTDVEVFPASHGLSLGLSQNFVVTASMHGPQAAHMRYEDYGLPDIGPDYLIHDE
jgi:spermidine synthase